MKHETSQSKVYNHTQGKKEVRYKLSHRCYFWITFRSKRERDEVVVTNHFEFKSIVYFSQANCHRIKNYCVVVVNGCLRSQNKFKVT